MFVALLSAAPGASGSGGSFREVFGHNPYFFIINFAVSAIVLATVVERLIFQLGKYRVNSKEFFAQVKKLVAIYSAKTGHPVHINSVVDPTVLGGMRIQVGDEVTDNTVVAQLQHLQRTVKATA